MFELRQCTMGTAGYFQAIYTCPRRGRLLIYDGWQPLLAKPGGPTYGAPQTAPIDDAKAQEKLAAVALRAAADWLDAQ